ncbi:MAG: isocitrate lyase/phosphoenolpyruvate mutase family protein [Chloroflexi bacterium]|nr:isocitrate lyase/phosphoenolpyruvate mutase family protein [Chloroflexota bacterium]MCH9038589.1 isocitrate lyase/phosphoenolpyruvate mutase family protein [Chloroflexota bacterium]MCI0791272.1 isocitrate lyase/phosphoenolpyruvate mutase family protein [Chloroflexota bacterium]MCI0796900.1 isocitrate lyase/phosphoenolpyruvate mutase family protein [Chloroflexota bacterium]MCI0870038.1 isocitrate lyase/phosphoenolpyruvate mutase family protein [Chloroflexota bacterium]
MELTQRRLNYRSILEGDVCVHPASVFDPISARIAEDLGFEIGMFAGSIASFTVLGDPDLIILTLTEFAQQIHRICRAGNLSLMVDADHGYGNALNVRRTVEELETAGVSCLTIEDTVLPIAYGHPKGGELISLDEGVGKMKAALSARQDPNLVVAGRTSALAFSGIPEAIRRAKAYEQAGVDALFMAGASTREEIEAVNAEVNIPLLLGGAGGELSDKNFLGANGVRVALQGHLPFSAAVKGVYDTLKALREGVAPADLRDAIASPDLMAQVTRKPKYDSAINEFLT